MVSAERLLRHSLPPLVGAVFPDTPSTAAISFSDTCKNIEDKTKANLPPRPADRKTRNVQITFTLKRIHDDIL